jgi:acyl carrier protein
LTSPGARPPAAALDVVREHLLATCQASGLFAAEVPVDCDADLVESGLIDSMGLLTLQSLAEETYGVLIPEAIFVAELRTLTQVAAYLDGAIGAEARAGLGAPPSAREDGT